MSIRPRIHVIGAGGTIAGTSSTSMSAAYEPGRVDTNDLMATVAGLDRVADIGVETLFSIGSEDLGPGQWLKLGERVLAAANRSDVDGVVVAHGTDTLEEAAFFLDLLCRTEKPVVMTAAMRASTALSADGPANIYHAVLAAGDQRLGDCGVLVVMNGLLLPGWQAVKTNSVSLDSFRAYPSGPFGRFLGEQLMVFDSVRRAPLSGAFFGRHGGTDDLPEVGVVSLYGGCGDTPLRLWRGTGCRGLVIAAFGAGTMPAPLAEAAQEMVEEGCVIVVSSRVGEVTVQPETMTLHGGGLLASGFLNPPKAAILLSLALADSLSVPEIQQLLGRTYGRADGPASGGE